MAKKFGRLALFSALAGAAAAGTYYYLQNKKHDSLDVFDDADDFDDFDDDLDDEADSSANTTSTTGTKNRPYVSLDLDNAKEIIGEKVIETIDKTKETLDKAKEFIEEKTAPPAESTYTQVDIPQTDISQADMPQSDISQTDTSTASSTEPASESSVSATYASDETKTSDMEEFYDDSEKQTE